ncbi:unconventional myosin-XVI-like isoform X2 [Antedon mediterranea]|uniref:unconventional myosin-XVI-like isoform X2 n=1 Tax=Antedon mediterranea TaxID=105859 RepID=UPI003AF55D33
MESIEQSLLENLPRTQRLKLAKKFRQDQIKRFNAWQKQAKDSPRRSKKKNKNKKGFNVNFDVCNKFRDAVSRFDDQEVIILLDRGADVNTASDIGVSVLHQCCVDDNLSVAEILIQRGADINARDDDWWTPLHTACACENSEIVNLLLSNGADAKLIDIDGNAPIDHTPAGSDTRQVMEQHMKTLGYTDEELRNIKNQTAHDMLSEVQEFVNTGGNVNATTDSGISLMHVAAANNYRDVVRLLSEHKANIDLQDNEGCTPLHLSSKFGNTRMTKLLVKNGANPFIVNNDGDKPKTIAATDLIEDILKAAEQEYKPEKAQQTVSDEPIYDAAIYEDTVSLLRLNSKTIRPRHISLSKSDMIFESETRLPGDEEKREEDEEEEDYVYRGFKIPKEKEAGFLPKTSQTDDLASVANLTQNTLLQELMLRYTKDQIYTYVGDILISVNPFKELPIYSKSISKQFVGIVDRGKLSPHIYAVADRSFQTLVRGKRSQCCIISGESGAGKTEACKYFVQHLLWSAQSDENFLNNKIQQVNPLLECFGNAQTVMNDNSSRFGKYLEIQFSENGHVQGAKISEYLLEKSRIVYQNEGERNFHIFYLMFSGLSPDEKKRYSLDFPSRHFYLSNTTDTKDLTSPKNVERFFGVRECLRLIGFTSDDEDNLFRILASLLHIGDIEFKKLDNSDAAVIINPEVLDIVSEFLQVPAEDLEAAIISESNFVRGEMIKRERNVSQACDCRDALAKALYGRLFSWVVNSINQLLQPLEDAPASVDIGVLDIFGFENFTKNSFEQICINVANEQLQTFFNRHIFQLERQDCEIEGIKMDNIQFTNNEPIVNIFLQKHVGIFAILDEESHFPKASDKSLAQKLHNGPGATGKGIYFTPKDKGTTFQILHYAGQVKYDLTGVLEKNRDTLPKSILFTMKTSNSLVVRELFQGRLTRTGSLAPSARQRQSRKSQKNTHDAFEFFKKKKAPDVARKPLKKKGPPVNVTERKGPATVAFHFKNSLAELILKMSKCVPHFVRCIKPNTTKKPDKFVPEYVIAQMRYTGIMETIRIRQQGFAMRITFEEFLSRYYALTLGSVPMNSTLPVLQKCKKALESCQLKDFKVGKTKLFFRYWHVEKLAALCAKEDKKINICQKVIRGFIVRREFNRKLEKLSRQRKYISSFLQDLQTRGNAFHKTFVELNEHDTITDLEEELINIADDNGKKCKQVTNNNESDFVDMATNGHVVLNSHDIDSKYIEVLNHQAPPPPSLADMPQTPYNDDYIVPQPVDDSYEELQQMYNLPPPPPPPTTDEYFEIEDLPPPPPMAEVPFQNIANIRERFLQQEKEETHKEKQKKRQSAPGNFGVIPNTDADLYDSIQPAARIKDTISQLQSRNPNADTPAQKAAKTQQRISSPAGFYTDQVINGKSRIPPPPTPKRNPDTRLSEMTNSRLSMPIVPIPEGIPTQFTNIPPPPSEPAPTPPALPPGRPNSSVFTNVPPPPSIPAPTPPRAPAYVPPPSYPNSSTGGQRPPSVLTFPGSSMSVPPPPPGPAPVPPVVGPPFAPPFAPPPPPTGPPAPPPPPPPGFGGPSAPPPPAIGGFAGRTQGPVRPNMQQPSGGLNISDITKIKLKPAQITERTVASTPADSICAEINKGITLRPTNKNIRGPGTQTNSNQNNGIPPPPNAPAPTPPVPPPPFGPAPTPPVVGDKQSPPPPATKPKPKPVDKVKTSPASPKLGPKSPGPMDPVQKAAPELVFDESIPVWKQAMLNKKHAEAKKMEEEELKKKQHEEDKWKGIPDWKKKIMMDKERKRQEEEASKIDPVEEERRVKLMAMPAWKRDLLMKKQGNGE